MKIKVKTETETERREITFRNIFLEKDMIHVKFVYYDKFNKKGFSEGYEHYSTSFRGCLNKKTGEIWSLNSRDNLEPHEEELIREEWIKVRKEFEK